ncbi:MAG: class I SAM-dependent methyltransferase [Syntrophomonadaceae bacterium]|jgi:16S rRNA (guanine1516-N2)-methyltransferase
MKIIITTTQSGTVADSENLNKFICSSGFEFVSRERKSIKSLIEENQADAVAVWEPEGPVLYVENEKFFFHPSMAKNRITAYRNKNACDLMAKACAIKPGNDFLDCTLGLGADAIVASYFSQTGRVVGLEVSPGIYEIVKWGMKLYCSRMTWLNEAIHRIEIVHSDHYDYLRRQEDNSFDIVYFDPMFRQPLLHSEALAPLRKLADHSPLQKEAVLEACRVARRRVVMKEQADSQEMERLGFKKVPGSKHNPIGYGVIEVG